MKVIFGMQEDVRRPWKIAANIYGGLTVALSN